MERLIIKKTDDVASVVERFIDATSDVVVIEIPPGALFGQNTTNFKLLKREAALLGREVIIETTDEPIRERAVKAGLGIGESLATIESIEEPAEPVRTKRTRTARKPRTVRVAVVPETLAADESEEAPQEEAPESEEEESDVATRFIARGRAQAAGKGREVKRVGREPVRFVARTKKFWKTIIIAGGVSAAVLVYLAVSVFPRATIVIATEKKSWDFDGAIVVDKDLSRIDVAGGRIPGQVFVLKDSVTKRVPATGKQYVSRKATGTLTVYNEYSSQPQSIVASTRFVTPTGVVLRTNTPLTIPGAKIENGKIIASSIEVAVTADKAGGEGNVGPTARLTIPGFSKTPKFDGFYGQLKTGTTGGFVGTTSVPTESDASAAKKEGLALVTSKLLVKKEGIVPTGFTTLEGASAVTLVSQTVESMADANGTVGVTTEAQLSVFAFREEDMKSLLASRVRSVVGPEFSVRTEKIAYGALNPKTVALSTGRMSVPLQYHVELMYSVTEDLVKEKLRGQADEKLNELIFQIPGITGGTVELWPFYVHTVPDSIHKISVEVN